MDVNAVRLISGADDPEFVALIAQLLLFRLGGQQSFTFSDLNSLSQDYIGMRTILDFDEKTFVLTLKPVLRSEGPG